METMLGERDALMVREYDLALDLAQFDTADSILDVATGSGRMLMQTLKRGHCVTSGDIDQQALDRARGRLGDLADKPRLLVMDAHNMEFPDESFRGVTFANAVHEIENPQGVIDEMVRVLTSDGKLLVVEFNLQGFLMMDMHHQMQGQSEHRKGEMSSEEIDFYLRSRFDNVQTREFSITCAWLASGKKQKKN